MERLPGSYAPHPDADPFPPTVLLLATWREPSTVAGQLDVFDTKALANYGSVFREKTVDCDIAWG